MTALVLAMIVLCGTVAGSYKEVQASDFSAGALQYGVDLSFLQSLFMAGGASLGLDMLLKTQNDIDKFKEENWDFGDLLDQPLTQKEIDEAQEKIEKLYYGATEAYKKSHGNGSKPTPTPMITEPPAPGVTPPVTVAPINPDDVTMPDDWATMKKNATDKGVLAMGAATAYCVKEAIKGWWDDIMDMEAGLSYDKNTYSYKDYIGYHELRGYSSDSSYTIISKTYAYDCFGSLEHNICMREVINEGFVTHRFYSKNRGPIGSFMVQTWPSTGKVSTYKTSDISVYNYLPYYNKYSSVEEEYHFFIPIIDSDGNVLQQAEQKPLGKSSMWPSTDTKDDYDNNNSLPTPSYPNLAVPSITLPTLDEIKDLWKQGSDDEENRPTYVTNFITNHTVQPTPEPEPTKKPEVNPNPGGGTDPNPKPSASPTPAVNPDPGGDGGTDPNPDPDPDNPDPDNPDPTPEEEASPYKADLRKVFPFCIPFDLIHLLKVFEADAEAPVFEFPLDIELDNPWTGEKVVDYHHTFELDMSDYEPVVKILRIFQVVFFIIALMLITRQQMIKG